MSVLDIIKSRHSVRDFKNQDIPTKAIDALIESLRWAPSAGNLQSRKFYFIFNIGIKRKLVKAALDQKFLAHAPLTVVACMDRKISARYGDRGVDLYAIQDTAASLMNMMLVAHELGLGSVWVGAFDEVEVSGILHLPANLRPIAIVPIGFPASVPSRTPRVSKEEVAVLVK